MSEKEFLGVSNASSNIRQVNIKEANCNEICMFVKLYKNRNNVYNSKSHDFF